MFRRLTEIVFNRSADIGPPLPRRITSRASIRVSRTTFVVAFALALVALPAAGREVAGWLETARLEPEGIELSAKLDTGADVSSLGAEAIRVVPNAGETSVHFRVQTPGGGLELQRPLVRNAWIKRHDAPPEQRPVVRLRFCVGGVDKEVEVNLVDRSNYAYPLLIGRNFLAGDLLVDPGERFSVSPACSANGNH